MVLLLVLPIEMRPLLLCLCSAIGTATCPPGQLPSPRLSCPHLSFINCLRSPLLPAPCCSRLHQHVPQPEQYPPR
jgi:hypothetical protein